MIYSFHHYNHWVKGGVETGLAHRAKLFRNLGLEAKFVFATTFPEHNIWNEIEEMGFSDSEVLWMYGLFTDCKPSAVVYTLYFFKRRNDCKIPVSQFKCLLCGFFDG